MTELKHPQQFGGLVELNPRRPSSQMMPYLVPFQPQTRIYPPKRRLEIAIEVQTGMDAPSPVKIIHNV